MCLLKTHVASVCFECFRYFRGMLQVSDGCYKSRSGCCICCNGCTPMLQRYVTNILSVFLDVRGKCVYLDVAYVSHICCKCFVWMLCMFTVVFKRF